ncbi:MAG: cupin domain-containing protein [Flavobacteriales bacterium]|nr:cupin domain-containing protein [Flavobacteriales bacterium]
MADPRSFEPGTLELYVLGALAPDQMDRVRQAVEQDAAVRRAVEDLQHALETLAWVRSTPPPPELRDRILGTWAHVAADHTPMCVIDDHTRTADLPGWIFALADPAPGDYENMHVHYLDCPPELASAVVWVKHYVTEEEHDACHESFHILEGRCEVLIGDVVRHMGPGESITIPLHVPHSVRVTSSYPCKAVVQRRPLQLG